MSEQTNAEHRKTMSSVRSGINLAIVICVAIAFLFVGIFVLDDFNANIQNTASFWIQKVLSGVGSLLILFSCANITEETLKRKNKSFAQRLECLDEHYATVMQNGETTALETYLTNKNKRSKYRAYLNRYKRLIKLAKSDKLKSYFENQLLLTPDEVWDLVVPKIRYYKLTFDKLVSGAYNVSQNDDANDLNVHRTKYMFQKTLWKIVCIIGFGCSVPDLAYHFTEFSTAMILPLIFKIVVILWAIYSGISFGYMMMDRVLVVLKRKLVIFSEFRKRTDDTTINDGVRYTVSIEQDMFVEKLKSRQINEKSLKNHLIETADVTNDVTNCEKCGQL